MSSHSVQAFLKGITVLDISRLVPGPFCSSLLIQLGARVIKLEDPGAGDYLRGIPPYSKSGDGALFTAYNVGKENIVVDLKQNEGKKIFEKLLKKCDVLIESFRPSVMAKLGFNEKVLKKINKKLIVASITGYGQQGDLKDLAGHDMNYMAQAGLLRGGDYPCVPYADLVGGGFQAALMIIAALRQKSFVHLDISMTDSMKVLSLASHIVAEAEKIEAPFKGYEFIMGILARYRMYRTKDDKWIALAALEGKFWNKLCTLAGKNHLIDPSDSYHDVASSAHNEMQAYFLTKTRDEWEKFGKLHDVCLTSVLAPREVDHETKMKVVPKGNDTKKILAKIGYSAKQLKKLYQTGVVG